MNDKPLITVAIPTRERCETLKYTLRTALEQKADDYEVVVCDNFSHDDTRNVVKAFADPRVVYLNTGERLSMCDNWDHALRHARGDYVIFVGDDDAVIPGAIDRLRVLIGERPHDVYMWTTPTYIWPIDEHDPVVEDERGSERPHELDLKAMARFVIANGGWRYYRIPGTYHAAVSKSILDTIRDRTGRVFHTTQPDLFTSMAVPVFARSCLHTGQAITIQGRSAKSNGGASVARDGPAVQARFIAECGQYRVHPTLFPNAPTIANLICDAILVAKDQFGEFYEGVEFNYEAMWAFMCRLGLVSRRDVLKNRFAFRRYHAFKVPAFLLKLVVHDLSALRRAVLNSAQRQRVSAKPPNDIWLFARQLAANKS